MKCYTDLDKLKSDLVAMGWRHFKLSNEQGDVIKFNQGANKAEAQIEDICNYLNSDATIKGTYVVGFKRTISDTITNVKFEKLIGAEPYSLEQVTNKRTPTMTADQIIELAAARVEIKYLTQNNEELKARIARLEEELKEAREDSAGALADNGNEKILDLADKFAPTINSLAEVLLNRFIPGPQPTPALPMFSNGAQNHQYNQAEQASQQEPRQKRQQNQIVRGSEQHYNYIRNSILAGALDNPTQAPLINIEIEQLAQRNQELYNKLLNEFDNEETENDSIDAIGENPVEEE
jgi:hypothetical protein